VKHGGMEIDQKLRLASLVATLGLFALAAMGLHLGVHIPVLDGGGVSDIRRFR
jgi:hypothetical protein